MVTGGIERKQEAYGPWRSAWGPTWPFATVPHILRFQGVKIELIFFSTGSPFGDMGRFSKLPYLGMKLSNWTKCQTLHIYPLSTPRGRNSACFSSTGSVFRDTGWFSKLPYLGMKLDHWPKCQKFAHILPFYPRGSKLSLFFFTLWAVVSEIRADFQNCHIWGWNLAIGQSARSWTSSESVAPRFPITASRAGKQILSY